MTAARVVLDDPWDRAVTADARAFTLAQFGIAEFWAGNADSAADHLTAAAGQAAACANDQCCSSRMRTEPRRKCGAATCPPASHADARLSISRSSVGGRAAPGGDGLRLARGRASLAARAGEGRAVRGQGGPRNRRIRRAPPAYHCGAGTGARVLLMRGESLQALEGLRASVRGSPAAHPRLRAGLGRSGGGRAPARARRARARMVGARRASRRTGMPPTWRSASPRSSSLRGIQRPPSRA